MITSIASRLEDDEPLATSKKTKMTGRQMFRIVAPVLSIVAMCLRIFPRRIVANFWWVVEWLPGLFGVGLRYAFLKRLCKECGDLVQIGPGVAISHFENISFGSNVNIHRLCYLDARGGIEIGDNVSIAHASTLLAFDHTWEDDTIPIKYNPLVTRPVKIGSDVWVGCGVRILSGVTVHERTIIAAGAVVRRGEYRRGVYGGVPAKLLSEIPSTCNSDNADLVGAFTS